MKLNLFNRIRVEIGKPPVAKKVKSITAAEVEDTIVILYDEFVKTHGPTTKNVFSIATQVQVAKRLGVTANQVYQATRSLAHYGFAKYKEEVLVRQGRGHFWFSEQFRHFMPKHDLGQCWSDDEAWHNTHHVPQTQESVH